MFTFLRRITIFGTLTVLICFKTCFHEKVSKALHMEHIPLNLYLPSQSVIGFVGLNLWCVLSPCSPKHAQGYLTHDSLPPLIFAAAALFTIGFLGATLEFIWGAVKVMSQERVALLTSP